MLERCINMVAQNAQQIENLFCHKILEPIGPIGMDSIIDPVNILKSNMLKAMDILFADP